MELRIKLEARIDDNGYPALFLVVNGVAVQYEENMELKDLFGKFRKEASEQEDTGYRPIMRTETDKRTATEKLDDAIIQTLTGRKPGEIKKRDVVKCVLSLPRDGGLPLQVGKEYTVISVGRMKDIEKDRMVKVFELNDLEHGRVMGFEEEVEFVRENPPAQAPRYDFFEETRVCDKCGEMYTVRKDKNTGELIGPFACGCIAVKA